MLDFYRLLCTWRRLHSFQHKPIVEIHDDQLKRFKRLIEIAYRDVPMYRELYDSCGFHPSAVQGYEDTDKVPVLTKQFIRKFPIEKRITRIAFWQKLKKETTSGSTGEPTEIWSDETDSVIQAMKGLRLLREWSYSVFDNVVQVWRTDKEPKESIVQKFGLLRRQFISIMEESNAKVDLVRNSHCDVLFATRSSLEILAEELNARAVRIHPKFVVSSSETLTDEHKLLFKETFGCEILELYGCMEAGNVAWGCPAFPENLHVETETVMVNYWDTKELPDGSRTGRVALTNLENSVMPFIRFDPGDEIVLPHDQQCACGRSSPVLGRVRGRMEDILDHGGVKYGFHFFYNFFKNFLYIRKYKIVQYAGGEIEFRVQLKEDDESNRARCRADLAQVLDKYFHPLRILFVESFPIAISGKFKVTEKLPQALVTDATGIHGESR